jgi:hypothetical protein
MAALAARRTAEEAARKTREANLKKWRAIKCPEYTYLAPNKRYCMKDKVKTTQYLFKTGRALDCPTDYVRDPKDWKRCVYGKYLRQVLCKRGHRVD